MRETIVQYRCDVCGKEIPEDAVDTVHLGVDGAEYELELCAKHGKELRVALESYTSIAGGAGLVGEDQGADRPAAKNGLEGNGSGMSTAELSVVREWAREQGYEISDRGKLPSAVLEAWRSNGHSRRRRRARR